MEMEMNTGMLWYDDDPGLDLFSKIEKARGYYIKKYGRSPNLCFINPSMLLNPMPKLSDISIQPDQMVLPNHFWLGVRGLAST
jgi:hypothetical protein